VLVTLCVDLWVYGGGALRVVHDGELAKEEEKKKTPRLQLPLLEIRGEVGNGRQSRRAMA
jgi:hypothetical protein